MPDPDPDPDPTPVGYTIDEFVMGADLSYVNVIQEEGGRYLENGELKNPFTIFAKNGTNLVRVRLWHNPEWQVQQYGSMRYSHLADVEKTIKRAKDEGMAVNLDFHYSDEWADPSKQFVPKAWEGLDLSTLSDSIYNYTLNTLNYLKSKNLTPEYVQVGNENNGGMCWPIGRVQNGNWSNFAALLQSGIKAVREFSATSDIKPKIILHVAQLQNAGWWTEGVIEKGGVTDFDVIGLSHYFVWSEVSTMAGVTNTIADLVSKYNKEVMIVETAYPWTSSNADGYNNIIPGTVGVENFGVSKEGQLEYMKALVQAIIDGGGTGIMYWEPGWITSPFEDSWGKGSSWENNAFFDFSGEKLPVMEYMTAEYEF
jgi:arabinogalactan endo-1,4-beta-galactosidase